MAIYRGPGGSGDATNDASSETRLAVEARDAAIAAKVAAEAAQVAAQLAETNAETAETNAETAETNAETAETNAEIAATDAASSASAASTSATNAAFSASSASTSATNAASSASSASSSASSASTSATNAATSATNASNSATTASTAATNASNSATAAASSASSASSSASTATTQASNASTSATNAASSASSASSSASTATTQAGIATTQATNAASSASAASTSATNASNSASAASTSATNAANSATSSASSASSSQAAADAALAALDSFDDRYLGQKSTAPTVDNDGNALVTGALYFDTVSNAMKVWDGSAWLSAYASLSGALLSTNNLSDLSSTSTARTNLGVTATGADTTYAYRANNLSDLASASTARTNLGLGTAATTAATDYATAAQGAKADTALQPAAIGVSVQAYDADLAAFALKTAPTGDVVGTSDTQTLTNKTIALGSNTISGTLAEFNTAVTDADFASLAGTETLTNKTLTSPTISGGTINNASIGATTASTGAFTSLSASGSFSANGGATLGDASGDALTINSSAVSIPNGLNFDSNTLVIDATNNRVGIGTSSPATKLSVEGSGAPVVGLIRSTDTNYSALQLRAATTPTANSWSIISGFDGTNTLGFRDNSVGERMRIDSSGNVGIGTSSPLQKLGVEGAGDTRIDVKSTDANPVSLQLRTSHTSPNNNNWSITAGSGGTRNLVFTDNLAGERMRIDSSGNVGIGTSSPTFTNGSGLFVERSGATAAIELFRSDATILGGLALLAGSSQNTISGYGAKPLTFNTNSIERMRIDTSGNFLFNSGYGSVATAYGCRAWVNFNGTGTVAIRASGNVSSITDLGTGNYRVNFTTAMPNTNYSVAGGASSSNCEAVIRFSSFATGNFILSIVDSNVPAFSDDSLISAVVFR